MYIEYDIFLSHIKNFARGLVRGIVKFLVPVFWVFLVRSEKSGVEDFPGDTLKKGFALRVGTRFITSIGPLVFAAWISIDGANISTSTQQFGSCSEIVLSNQGGDERWSDPFQVDRELADCDIAGQVFLMHSPEGPQKVA